MEYERPDPALSVLFHPAIYDLSANITTLALHHTSQLLNTHHKCMLWLSISHQLLWLRILHCNCSDSASPISCALTQHLRSQLFWLSISDHNCCDSASFITTAFCIKSALILHPHHNCSESAFMHHYCSDSASLISTAMTLYLTSQLLCLTIATALVWLNMSLHLPCLTQKVITTALVWLGNQKVAITCSPSAATDAA